MLSDRTSFWKNIRNFAMRPEKDCIAEPLAPDMADEFNREFASVGARIATELKENSRNEVGVSPKPPRVIAAKLTLHPVTLPELSKCLSDLSSSRAVGVDGVPLFAIKTVLPFLRPIYFISSMSRLSPVSFRPHGKRHQ